MTVNKEEHLIRIGPCLPEFENLPDELNQIFGESASKAVCWDFTFF